MMNNAKSNQMKESQPKEFVDVIVGGQAGSEGKGALTAHLTRTNNYGIAVRPGSSNAGHTVYDNEGDPHIHQVIPSSAVIDSNIDLAMAAESSFGLDEFDREVESVKDVFGGDTHDRIYIDPKSSVINEDHREAERERKLGEDIGSTVHGCGAVRAEKIWRSAGNVKLTENVEQLQPYTDGRVSHRVLQHGHEDRLALIEGTQGTLLSMNHSPHYPFTTSRDCTAMSFLSSVGLPPSAVRNVWVVFRTYPIRAGENSGPLAGEEISFETIAERAGHEEPPTELASVTERNRRAFEWSWEQFWYALALNDPDMIAITFLDYLSIENYGVDTFEDLTENTQEWIHQLNERLATRNTEIGLLKTGPKSQHVIDLQNEAHRKNVLN